MAKRTADPGQEQAREPWKAFQVRERSMELKRDAVLQTAAHLFLEHGYQKTSLSLLAARLKITKPALYYYFKNKEEILAECYSNGINVIEEYLKESGPGDGSGLARLQRYVRAYATALLTHDFGRCVALIDDAALSPAGQREVRALKRKIDESMRSLVELGVADGSIAKIDPKLVTFAIAGAINWAGTWYRPGGPLTAVDIARTFTHLLTSGLNRPAE